MAYRVLHLHMTDSQMEIISAKARIEYKTIAQLVRGAALDYCVYGQTHRKTDPRPPVIKLIEPVKEKDGTNEGL